MKNKNERKENQIPPNPYLAAQQEWDNRIGRAVVQARNWRVAALTALIIAMCLVGALAYILSLRQDRVFVAEVTKEGSVLNVLPLQERYNPTVAQQEYFIATFIELVRSLPLDPVLAKQNWLKSYRFLTQRAGQQLSAMLREKNPLDLLGKKTIVVKIIDANPISNLTFQVDWTETVYDISGNQEKVERFSGVFTTTVIQPKTQQQILQNPLGIYITDFHISSRG